MSSRRGAVIARVWTNRDGPIDGRSAPRRCKEAAAATPRSVTLKVPSTVAQMTRHAMYDVVAHRARPARPIITATTSAPTAAKLRRWHGLVRTVVAQLTVADQKVDVAAE